MAGLVDHLDEGRDDLPGLLEDEWAAYARSLARRGRSESTVKVYRKSFVHFWRWATTAGLEPDPAAIGRAEVNAWTDSLLSTPATRNRRPVMVTDPDTGEAVPKMLDASTRQIMWRNLRPFFSWFSDENDLPNPFDRADPPAGDRPAPIPVVPLDDLRRLLAACKGKTLADLRDSAMIRVLFDCGARRGELLAMTTASWNNRLGLLELTGKTGTRHVPPSLSTGEALDRWVLRRRKAHGEPWWGRHVDLPAMWIGPKGRLGESGIAQAIKRRCLQAGIEPINPHRFRHTWAHEFRAAGGSEGDLTHLAGWTSTAMAHRYGASAAAGRAQEAARRLALGDRL